MTSALSVINTLNETAYQLGLFDWQMQDASYTNPDGSQVSFMLIDGDLAPIEQFAAGVINTFNLVTGPSGKDPNKGLFNTVLSSGQVRGTIGRKYALNRIPYANYDQPVDLGVGSQRLVFNVIIAGTMYQTAYINIVQNLFNNATPGLGILQHPFYGKINNVLPIVINELYTFEQLNCIVCEMVFLTSDITHLNPSATKLSLTAEIGMWFIGVENAALSLAGALSGAIALGKNLVGGVK